MPENPTFFERLRNELHDRPRPAWMAALSSSVSAAGGGTKLQTFFRRSASTLALWAVVVAVFASGRLWAFDLFIGALALLGTWEYFRMAQTAGLRCYPGYGMAVAMAYLAALFWVGASGRVEALATLVLAALFLAITGPFFLELRRPVEGLSTLQTVAVCTFGTLYPSFLFGLAACLTALIPGPGEVPGAMLLLWVIAVTKFTDMGAYLTGSLIGRHKMIPHISPGKTWEGFGGALLFALLAGCSLYAIFFHDMEGFGTGLHILGGWGAVVGLSLVLALFAVVGDLAESIVKRALGAKDSGRMLPGIGGALDLIDSLCFTIPVLYFYLQWVALQ